MLISRWFERKATNGLEKTIDGRKDSNNYQGSARIVKKNIIQNKYHFNFLSKLPNWLGECYGLDNHTFDVTFDKDFKIFCEQDGETWIEWQYSPSV